MGSVDSPFIKEASDCYSDNPGSTDVDLSSAGSGVKLVKQVVEAKPRFAGSPRVLRQADGHVPNVCHRWVLARFQFRALTYSLDSSVPESNTAKHLFRLSGIA